MFSSKEFARRRQAFMDQMDDGVALFPAGAEIIRNRDVHYEFRQQSDFYYLTGFEEPDAMLMLAPQSEHPVTLFVLPRDPEKESWEGPRWGEEGAISQFGADAAYPIDDAPAKVRDALKNQSNIYYCLGENRQWDTRVIDAMNFYRTRSRLGESGPSSIHDPNVILHDLRLVKSPEEVEMMAKAGNISARAHCEAMRICKPGINEAELQSVLEIVFRTHGSKRDAYPSIVATGNNATVLHYRANCDEVQSGDLVLIDAGCELGYLASDITRTFPASGRFTEAQKAVYQLVLDAQLAAIDECKPGNSFQQVHDRAVEVLAAGLVDLELIEGPVAEAISEERYKRFFWHRTSHWLGMDVHDVGNYQVEGEWQTFREGMVLTVEPGLYFSNTLTDVPKEYLGIGIRIEDDICITSSGNRNLTADVPKGVDEIEALMAGNPVVTWPSA